MNFGSSERRTNLFTSLCKKNIKNEVGLTNGNGVWRTGWNSELHSVYCEPCVENVVKIGRKRGWVIHVKCKRWIGEQWGEILEGDKVHKGL